MTLTIDLSPTEESWLAEAARQKGLAPAALVKQFVTERLPAQSPPMPEDQLEDPTLALFAQWTEEDARMTPEEIAEDNRIWEQFKENINAERDRAGARRVF